MEPVNPFYESMREVAPGDLIFSFMNTRILAVGIVQSYAGESPKPLELGSAGENWEGIGWKVEVQFTELANKIRPKDHIEILRPFLPAKYSPLQPNGNGLQSVYLTEVLAALAEVLIGLVRPRSCAASAVGNTDHSDCGGRLGCLGGQD
jgi:putative restriction endonuclease